MGGHTRRRRETCWCCYCRCGSSRQPNHWVLLTVEMLRQTMYVWEGREKVEKGLFI